MAKVKRWHIHVDTNGNVIGKPTNVVLSVALTPPTRPRRLGLRLQKP